ncbi:MAG: aminopeptidase P family protein [Spirochaetaceae bacterium]|nr:MAG: aminopeptidase P family protein [Spirochaetaceae bacterium]
MLSTKQASTAMREENLSAWLFSNFHHKDPISDRILEISPGATNSRPWIYLLRQDGSAEKLVHVIENKILDHLPGHGRVYASRQEYLSHLKEMAAGLRDVACHFSAQLPAISFLDHGTAGLLEECGFSLSSASSLIQRLLGGLDQAGIDSHRRAADYLYDVVAWVWERLRKEMRSGGPVWETTVQGWIMGKFEELGLITHSPPIVAVGRHSADPHYSPETGGSARGAALESGAVLQLDLWAKERAPGSIYADISWVGVLDARIPLEAQKVFHAVVEARELAFRFIEQSLAAGGDVSGEQVDRGVRAFLERSGYGDSLRHRTGHGIDQEVHGFGVNLDSVEFPDPRLILEGSCFSIEPGLYLDEFGMRSEINVYISGDKPVISGKHPQFEILHF